MGLGKRGLLVPTRSAALRLWGRRVAPLGGGRKSIALTANPDRGWGPGARAHCCTLPPPFMCIREPWKREELPDYHPPRCKVKHADSSGVNLSEPSEGLASSPRAAWVCFRLVRNMAVCFTNKCMFTSEGGLGLVGESLLRVGKKPAFRLDFTEVLSE